MRLATVNADFTQPPHLGTLPTRANISRSLRYIPGRTLRGALATAYLRVHGPRGLASDEFVQLTEGGVRFGPLFAGGVSPHAMSVQRHKYHGDEGCPADEDLALSGAMPKASCDNCGSPLEFGKGEIDSSSSPVSARHHTSMDEYDIARDSQLFGRESLQASRFSGEIIAPDHLLRVLGTLGPAWIGGRTTTHGRATIEISDEDAGFAPNVITDPATNRAVLLVRLQSDAVFVDEQGFPTRTPSLVQIADTLNIEPRSLKLQRTWARWAEAGGWHGPSALPRPVELTVAAGSTFRIAISGPAPDDTALQRLRLQGLGIRRHEGFGHITGVAVPTTPAPPLDLGRIDMLPALFARIQNAAPQLNALTSDDPERSAKARDSIGRGILPVMRRQVGQFTQSECDAVVYLLGLSPDDLAHAARRWTS